MKLRLAHSPDPDDAFLFYGMVSGAVSIPGVRFEHVLRDIETLNRWAIEGRVEITALSFHALARAAQRYALIPWGASVGDGYGPVIVSRDPLDVRRLGTARVAVPGELTTAFLVFRLLLPGARHVVMPFDAILPAVASGAVEAGILIHEGQLTYEGHGLTRALDLGARWREETGLPLPLGANAVRRDMGPETMVAVSRAVHDSIRYALTHRQDAVRHALPWARGLDASRTDRFIGMYVDEVSMEEPRRRKAVEELWRRGMEAGLIPQAELEIVPER